MRIFSQIFLRYHEIYSIQLAINKNYTHIPVLVNSYGLLHFTPIQVKSTSEKEFKAYALGSCAQMLDLPTLANTKYIYTYKASGDLDTNYLANKYIKYTTDYEVQKKVYPITNIELPTNLEVNDILLSCPGIHPPLSKIITQDRLR
jgi:hypothetical protein